MCGTPQGATLTEDTYFLPFLLSPTRYLRDHGILTYSGDKIQVSNVFIGFHSRCSLCK